MSFLEGYKTKIAGVLAMLYALAGGIMGLVDPTSPIVLPLPVAIPMFLGGLAALGLRLAISDLLTKLLGK